MQTSLRRWWLFPTVTVATVAGVSQFILWSQSYQPIFLWSDILVAALLCFIFYLVSYIRTREHLAAPWREVFHRKLAMVAFIVLVVYGAIAVLDSIHFRQPLANQEPSKPIVHEIQVVSLLDVLVTPLRTKVEHTYSAPLSAYANAKETIEQKDGSQLRDYPRLKYGGAHLTDPEHQLVGDIVGIIFQSFVISIAVAALIIIMTIGSLAMHAQNSLKVTVQHIWQERTLAPWRVIFGTITFVVFIIVCLIMLSSSYHVFGTDKVGQDVLYLSIKSIRTGMLIGTLATLVMLPFAVLLGMMAGYFRGIIDDIIQYIYTTLSSIPFVLLIAAAVLSIHVYIESHKESITMIEQQSDLRLVALCIILGITSWTGLCRLLRGETMKIRTIDYIQAATALGVSHLRILSRHVLPNVMHIVLIAIVLDFSALVLAEAVLSYVGIGVDQSTNSWGNMINSARLELGREPIVWWPLLAAFSLMFVLVLAANLFSDAVRDSFDPKLRRLGGRDL